MLETVDAVFNIPAIPDLPPVQDLTQLTNVSNFQVGTGNRSMKVDRSGQWLGAKKFADAPFSVDMDGNVIANSIRISSSSLANSANGINQQFTTATEADITNATQTIILERPTIVFAIAKITGYIYRSTGSADFFANGIIRLYDNAVEKQRTFISGGKTGGTDQYGAVALTGVTIHYLAALAVGTHVIKLTGIDADKVGAGSLNIYNYSLSLVTLGNA